MASDREESELFQIAIYIRAKFPVDHVGITQSGSLHLTHDFFFQSG